MGYLQHFIATMWPWEKLYFLLNLQMAFSLSPQPDWAMELLFSFSAWYNFKLFQNPQFYTLRNVNIWLDFLVSQKK